MDVLERVSGHADDVGELAGLDAAEAVLDARRMSLTLPKAASDKVKLQGVADQLVQFFRDGEGRLNLDFRVGGRADAPTLSLDTRAQEAALKQKLMDEAAKKLSDPLKKLFKPKP